MALSPIIQTSVQCALLTGVSNVLAQLITAYREGNDFSINWIPVFQFILFAFLNTPHNFLWQQFLESTFPAHPEAPKPHPKKSDDTQTKPSTPKLSIRNTIIKLVLDQTLAGFVNTLVFSMFTRSLRTAMSTAPRITNFSKAATYWTSPGAIDFKKVNFDQVWRESKAEFWPIVRAAWTLWPFVSLVNFTLVKTVEGRNLVGSLAGIAWGVYMSLVSS